MNSRIDTMTFRNELDPYSKRAGIRVLEVQKNFVKTEMTITPEKMNPIQSVHGGEIFTLMDISGGTAAYHKGAFSTTISASINYLTAARNTGKLFAVTREVKAGKRILVYQIDVTDEAGVLIAVGTFSYSVLEARVQNPER